jgi:hypothetical protein
MRSAAQRLPHRAQLHRARRSSRQPRRRAPSTTASRPAPAAHPSFRQPIPKLTKQRLVAQQAITSFNACRETAAGKDLHVLRRLPLQSKTRCKIDNCVGQRMVRSLLRSRSHAQQLAVLLLPQSPSLSRVPPLSQHRPSHGHRSGLVEQRSRPGARAAPALRRP